MKVRLPLMVLDQFELLGADEEPVERYFFDDEPDEHGQAKFVSERFLPGPVTSRVAILDFDETTGALHPAIELGGTAAVARYLVDDGAPGAELDFESREFQAVSVLGAILYALHLFEAPDVLGREVEWAFEGKQLLVIPRAGNWKNAYYQRETASLQFFSFRGDEAVPVVHTSLSLDIVSHEVGHAILDAIAPYLYHCITPESLALHEAVGDMTALLTSLDRPLLRTRLIDETDGDLARDNEFTRVAPAFGHYRNGDDSLRSMWNQRTLDTIANPNDTHTLSEVVSGMVYELLVWAYDRRRVEELEDGHERKPALGRAVEFAANLTRRVAWRGLDYLPPGEITFGDYVRAAVAADAVANPDDPDCRTKLIEIADRRAIGEPADLAYQIPDFAPSDLDIDELASSESYAYGFVERHRSDLHVPGGVGFLIERRLEIEKTAFRTGGSATYRELIMKISWEQLEEGRRKRWIRFGTTVVFDRDTHRVVAILTTNPGVSVDERSDARGLMLDHLIDDGWIDETDEDMGDDHRGFRIRGSGRTLHASGLDGDVPVDIEAELAAYQTVVAGEE